MSASLSVEPRRSPGSRKPSRDLPVLFHLIDVSRHKPVAKVLPSVVTQTEEADDALQGSRCKPLLPEVSPELAGKLLENPEQAHSHGEPSLVDAAQPLADIEPHCPQSLRQPHDTLPGVGNESISALPPESAAFSTPPEFKPLILPDPPAANHAAHAAEGVADVPCETPCEPQSEQPVAADTAGSAAPEAALACDPAAIEPDAAGDVSPRSLAKTALASNWFATQGKYIAIAFAIALLGTIVLARLNRRSAPVVVDHKHSHPGEAGHKLAAANVASEATIVGQASHGGGEAKTTSNVLETSPAQLAESQPQTDLHPPSIPQLTAQPGPGSAVEPAKDESLFPWAKPEDRVAARPESPTSTAPQLEPAAAPASPAIYPQTTTAAAPTVPVAAAPAPAAAPSPALAPQYPVTAATAPAFSAAAPAYPTTSTPNQYQYQPVAPAPNTQPASGPALAPPTGGSQYFPQDNSASGSRYERTGSGLY